MFGNQIGAGQAGSALVGQNSGVSDVEEAVLSCKEIASTEVNATACSCRRARVSPCAATRFTVIRTAGSSSSLTLSISNLRGVSSESMNTRGRDAVDLTTGVLSSEVTG
jgi:hypothetical protein